MTCARCGAALIFLIRAAAAFKIKVLSRETTQRGEDETGEEQGGREVKVTVISFPVSSNEDLHPGGGQAKVTADPVPCPKRSGTIVSLTPQHSVSL